MIKEINFLYKWQVNCRDALVVYFPYWYSTTANVFLFWGIKNVVLMEMAHQQEDHKCKYDYVIKITKA